MLRRRRADHRLELFDRRRLDRGLEPRRRPGRENPAPDRRRRARALQDLVKLGMRETAGRTRCVRRPSWAFPGVSNNQRLSRCSSPRRRGVGRATLARWSDGRAPDPARRRPRCARHSIAAADQPGRLVAADSQRQSGGATPYKDVVELNPPASILLYRLPALIGKLLSTRPEWIVAGMVALLVGGALAYAGSFIRRYRLEPSALGIEPAPHPNPSSAIAKRSSGASGRGAFPSPARGRRWPREARSDEGHG